MQRFPLHWPNAWPRTPASARRAARFRAVETRHSQRPTGPNGQMQNYSSTENKSLSIADARVRLMRELESLGVRDGDWILSTNVPTRLDGLPYSSAREPDDPGAAVYWIKRGWKSHKALAIDIYSRVADNISALAATIDAMRAIERHGGAIVLERVFSGFDALPAPGTLTARQWLDVLECRADSTRDTIEAQYKRKRSDAHPDRGGSTESFDEVQRAYRTAVALHERP